MKKDGGASPPQQQARPSVARASSATRRQSLSKAPSEKTSLAKMGVEEGAGAAGGGPQKTSSQQEMDKKLDAFAQQYDNQKIPLGFVHCLCFC